MNYRRISDEDRVRIEALYDAGLSRAEIARQLGFHRSNIGRELNRVSGREYSSKKAKKDATEKQKCRSQPRKLVGSLIQKIKQLLSKRWSPLQIAKRIFLEQKVKISHEAIYQFIYNDYKNGGELYKKLRLSHKERKARFPRKSKDRRGTIKDAVSIEQRGEGANNRSRVGHWERDLMLGSNRSTSILMMVDRKTRYVRLGKLEKKTADLTLEKSLELLEEFDVKSITNDRGLEFAKHKELAEKLNVPVYFCHPYTSSERGTVENRIGVLRQYYPKGADLSGVTDKELLETEIEINSRPMRCLDWRNPFEVTFGCNVALTT